MVVTNRLCFRDEITRYILPSDIVVSDSSVSDTKSFGNPRLTFGWYCSRSSTSGSLGNQNQVCNPVPSEYMFDMVCNLTSL